MSGRLTIWIDGREALPVRAIPYVADWGKASPEWLTDYLEQGTNVPQGAVPLTAYQCVNHEPVAVLPREWKIVAAKVNGIVQALHEQRQHLSPISDHAGYAAYQTSAIKALPAGVFVLLEEFADTYKNHCERNHLGIDTLTLSPVAANDEVTRAAVLEGFDEFLAQAGSEGDTEKVGDRGTATAETIVRIKRNALIEKYEREWPAIEDDLRHSNENGLRQAAKISNEHGYWNEPAVVRWGSERGKLQVKQKLEAPKLDTMTTWGLRQPT